MTVNIYDTDMPDYYHLGYVGQICWNSEDSTEVDNISNRSSAEIPDGDDALNERYDNYYPID
jgi:hypothetical protein